MQHQSPESRGAAGAFPQQPLRAVRPRGLCTWPPRLISVVIRAIYNNIASAVHTDSLLVVLTSLLLLPPLLASRQPLAITVAVAVAAPNITYVAAPRITYVVIHTAIRIAY